MMHRVASAVPVVVMMLLSGLPAASIVGDAWGNGDPQSEEWPNFGVHDISCDIAHRTAKLISDEQMTWLNDWYIRNATDWGYSFDISNTQPTDTDNVNAYTDDPDSYWKDWENHTLYLHPRSGWPPPVGDAARRVSQLYNMTRDHLYAWMMNGSVRYDVDQHYAAYYAGLMAHYLMDVTQFGHTDYTVKDHSHPPDDPEDATYHSYYEARSWTDIPLRHLHMDLMSYPLPEVERCTDPEQMVRDLAAFVNSRDGSETMYFDADGTMVPVGSTYLYMLRRFEAQWDQNISYNDARGYDQTLWNLTLENIRAGMDNLTGLWLSVYQDAHDRFVRDAADIVVEGIIVSPEQGAYEGQEMSFKVQVSNLGAMRTGDFDLVLYLDELDQVGAWILDLGPGVGTTVDFRWTAEAGAHRFTAVADASDQVAEANTTNNLMDVHYFVVAEYHMSVLTAEPVVMDLLQDDGGTFVMTLENRGNKPDVFDISVSALPGTIDFSITLPVGDVFVPATSCETFTVEVSTLLTNPVGPRAFSVNATGGNSTSSVGLTLVIAERQLPPFIEVEYGFYGNVSVPVAFDASESWDHNNDEVFFKWDFGDGSTGEGAVVEHAYAEEGVYVINLTAYDGSLESHRTLEVSILDAIPPDRWLRVNATDLDAALLEWGVWMSPRYFSEYRVFVAHSPEVQDLLSSRNMVTNVTLLHQGSAVVPIPEEDMLYACVVTVNIYGDGFRSNVVEVVPRLHTADYPEGHPLDQTPILASSDAANTINVRWREWAPLLVGPDRLYTPGLISTTVVSGYRPVTELQEIDLLTNNSWTFTLLPAGEFEVWVDYVIGEDRSFRIGPVHVEVVDNVPPAVSGAPDALEARMGDRVTLELNVSDMDDTRVQVAVDWGEGDPYPIRIYDLVNGSITLVFNHTYLEEGTYSVNISAISPTQLWKWRDNDTMYRDGAFLTIAVTVAGPTEAGGDGDTGWDWLIAIALILFVAFLGYLAGHATGYFKMGKRGEPFLADGDEGEGEGEPRPTAEDIVSELETEAREGEDDEYLDHEPTVAELEAMIPRPPKD